MWESTRPGSARFAAIRIVAAALLIANAVMINDGPSLVSTRAQGIAVRDVHVEATYRPWFSDVTARTGVPLAERQSWGATFVDFAGGRLPDLFLNRHRRAPDQLVNQHGIFSLTTETWPSPMDRHTCGWGEANGDGALDLLCLQGGLRPNELWLNQADAFVEAASAFGLDGPGLRGRGLSWIDYDRDGDLDVFATAVDGAWLFRNDRGAFVPAEIGATIGGTAIASTWTDWNGDRWPDLLLVRTKRTILALQNTGGHFTRVRLPGVPAEVWGSALFADLDGDGWQDLHLVRRTRSLILRNVDGRFTTIKDRSIRRARTSVALDADNDGLLDLYLVRSAIGSDPNQTHDLADMLLLQREGRSFDTVRLTETRGWAGSGDGVAAADFDGDGGMDVLVTNGWVRWRGPAVLLRNRLVRGNWARIHLEGTRWNPAGFGALITVRTSDGVSKRLLTDGIVWRSQSDVGNVHVGLGDASRARVTVRWPNGRRDCVSLRAGRTMTLRIGQSPCA